MVSWEAVYRALSNPNYKWRTIRGITKELGEDEDSIKTLLNQHSSEIIKSSISAQSGEDLYTTRDHYRKNANLFDKFTSSITGSVSGVSGASGVYGVSGEYNIEEEGEENE